MTGSDTLGLVLTKVGYVHATHEKEAGVFGAIGSGISKIAPTMARLASRSRGLFARGAARGIGTAESVAARGGTLPRPNIPTGWDARALQRQAAGIPRTADPLAPRVWRGGTSQTPPPLPRGIGDAGRASQRAAGAAATGGGAAAAAGAADDVGGAAARTYPRFWNRSKPIQGTYGFVPGAKWLGGKLDNWANTGWAGRIMSAPFRRLMPGQGLYGTAGLAYGGMQGFNAAEAGRRTEEMSTAAAAQAIRQMRNLGPLERLGAMYMGDDTVAGYLRKKQPGVAAAFEAQGADPTLFDRQVRDAPYQAMLPFYPRTR